MTEKFTQQEIKEKIDEINKKIEECFYPNQFTLNGEIMQLTRQIVELQDVCEHDYKDGICIYCYKAKGVN